MAFFTVITDIGRERLAAAALSGVPLAITNLAVGDAGGSDASPDTSASALVGERWRGDLNSVIATGARIEADGAVPADVGGFTVREAALLADDGVAIAIASIPPTYKPATGENADGLMIIRLVVDITGDTEAAVLVQQATGFATQQWALDAFRALHHRTRDVPGDGITFNVTATELFDSLVFESAADVFLVLPAQADLTLAAGVALWVRNRGVGDIWMISDDSGVIEGDGNRVASGSIAELRLEKPGNPNRWVSSGTSITTGVVPEPPPEPPTIENVATGNDGSAISTNDGGVLETNGV